MATPKTAITRAPSTPARPSTPAPNTKQAPSPAQQAARERFLARRPTNTPAPPKAPQQRSLAPSARPQKETLGSVVGSVAPTAIAGAALGFANGSSAGKKFEERFNVKVSRPIAAIAAVGKLFNVASVSPALDRGAGEILRSEINDLARAGGEGLASRVGSLLDTKAETKTEEAPKTETKPVVETTGIEVKDVTPKGANGVSQPATPKVTHEKNPTATA